MHKKKLNIAILGCGRISRNHINAIISEKNRCKLVAICDNSSENLNLILTYLTKVFKEKSIEHLPSKFFEYKNLLLAHQEKKNKN